MTALSPSPAASRLSRLGAAYFALQSVLVAAWWVLLVLRPELRPGSQLDPRSEAGLLAFWLPDLVLLSGGSLAASVACFRAGALTAPALWLVAGGVSYATLYCLGGSLITDAGWLSVALMAPSMLLSVAFAVALAPGSRHLFRQARPGSTRRNLAKTAGQIVLFWGVLLFLVPSLLAALQGRIGIPRVALPGQPALGAALFLGCSALGLWSGLVMSRLGRGTPLPLDSPRHLVVRGPYAFVRNPMAMAGLGQGVAVGVYTGSVLVLAYVLLGASSGSASPGRWRRRTCGPTSGRSSSGTGAR